MNKIDVTTLSPELTLVRLLPYMAHPNNVEARERYGAFLSAQQYSEDPDISRNTLKNLIEAARVGVGRDFHNSIQGGCMAGDVLLARIEMYAADVRDAGLDKACHIISEYYGGFHDNRGKKLKDGFSSGERKVFKAGRDTVLGNWKKYSNAAHLWAAYLILLRESEKNKVRDKPEIWLNGRKIASLATVLRNRAVKVPPVGNASPVLSTGAFEIIGVDPPLWMLPPELSEDFRAVLAVFKPRISPQTKGK